MIRTYDGRRAIIPNTDVFTNAVTVNTAFPLRRTEVDVGIGYGDRISAARDAILAALRDIKGLQPDPAADVLPWELAGSGVTLKVRWWTDSRRSDVVHVQARVIKVDGVRGKQREGWPPRTNGPQPRPARLDENGSPSG